MNEYRREIACARIHQAELYNYIQYDTNYDSTIFVKSIMVCSTGGVDMINVNNKCSDYDTVDCMGITYYIVNFDEEIQIDTIEVRGSQSLSPRLETNVSKVQCDDINYILIGQRELFGIKSGCFGAIKNI